MGFKRLRPSVAIRCLNKWGTDPQLSQTTEECLELAIAANHAKRAWHRNHGALSGGPIKEEVLEEMVDVENMIEQLKIMLDITPEEWNRMFDIKRKRIEEKLQRKSE